MSDLLLNFGFVPSSRLDGSHAADGRLMSNHESHAFADAGTAADRAAFADAPADSAAALAARLRLVLKSARASKAHEALFKASRALKSGVN